MEQIISLPLAVNYRCWRTLPGLPTRFIYAFPGGWRRSKP
jgi:hypothetical protein